MNCPRCGAQNDAQAKECQYCGTALDQQRQTYEPGHFSFPGHESPPQQQAPQQQRPPQPPPQPGQYGPPGGPPPYQSGPGQFGPGQPMPKVSNHMVFAILTTLFCCLPFGIVAIVHASKVNGRLQKGDYHGAVEAAGKAKTWCWVAFALGLVVQIINIVVNVANA